MVNKLVVVIPLLLLLFVLSWSTSNVLAMEGIVLPVPSVVLQLFDRQTAPDFISQYLPHTTTDEMRHAVNQSRLKQGLDKLEHDPAVCLEFTSWSNPTAEALFSSCENCRQVSLLKLSNQVEPDVVQRYLSENEEAMEVVASEQASHICVRERDDFHTVVLMTYGGDEDVERTTAPTPARQSPTKAVPPPTVVNQPADVKNFSDDELWDALISYRSSHNRSGLNREESLCSYARKRVDDHIRDFGSKPIDEYPQPDKYPLDAHAGFAADADTGYAFEVTGKNRLAENLAYWPSAAFANQVIEWGWDSSTEGHRETQLSEEYGSACLVGQDGFYVAIFGN